MGFARRTCWFDTEQPVAVRSQRHDFAREIRQRHRIGFRIGKNRDRVAVGFNQAIKFMMDHEQRTAETQDHEDDRTRESEPTVELPHDEIRVPASNALRR